MSPPVTTTSLSTKSVEASLSVNEMVAVPPVATLATLLETVTSGATVSTVIVFSVAAALSLPAASVKTPAGTLIVPDVVESASGVNTTV